LTEAPSFARGRVHSSQIGILILGTTGYNNVNVRLLLLYQQ